MGQQPARSITDAGCVHAILAMILECTRTGSESGRCRSTCGVFRERITSQVTSGHMWSSHQTVDCGPHILTPWAVCICQINPQIPAGITRLDQLNIFYNELSLYFFFKLSRARWRFLWSIFSRRQTPGAHFTNNCSITIQMWWKFHFALIQIII